MQPAATTLAAPAAATPGGPAKASAASRGRVLLRRHGWLLAVFLAALAVHLPYARPGGPCARNGDPWPLIHDEGTVLYDSWRIASGEAMYRDFFEFQGPVFYHAVAALYLASGPSPAAARAFILLVWALSAALLALVVARCAGRVAGAAAAAIHACLLVPFYAAAYPHWVAEAFTLGALVVLTAPHRGPRHDIAAGALAAAAAATIQSVGLPVLAALAGTAALPGLAARAWRRALAGPARVLGGAAAVLAAVALFCAARGALGALVYDVLVWPFIYYGKGQPKEAFAASAGWIAAHRKLPAAAGLAGLAGLYVTMALPWTTIAAAAAVAGRTLWALRRRAGDAAGGSDGGVHASGHPSGGGSGSGGSDGGVRASGHRSGGGSGGGGGGGSSSTVEAGPIAVATAAAAAVSPVLAGLTRQDLTHAAFVLGLGLAALGAVATPAWRGSRAATAALLGAVALVAAVAYGAKTLRTWAPSTRLPGWRAMALEFAPAKWLDTAVPPGAPVVDGLDHAGWVYLFVRPSAVAHTLIPRVKPEYFSDAQWQRLADEIVARRPAALTLAPEQWRLFTARRPEIAALYRSVGGGRWLLAAGP